MVSVTNQILKVMSNIDIMGKLEKAKEIDKERPVVFLCVGSFKLSYDCFGPLMGSLLQALDIKYYIYGNIRCNINAQNLENYIKIIHNFHINPYIIVIDSAISSGEEFELKASEGALTVAAMSQNRVSVGDLSLILSVPASKMHGTAVYKNVLSGAKRLGRFIEFVFGENDTKL